MSDDAEAAPREAEVVAELPANLGERAVADPNEVRAAWADELERRARRAMSGEDKGEAWPALRRRLEEKLGP